MILVIFFLPYYKLSQEFQSHLEELENNVVREIVKFCAHCCVPSFPPPTEKSE